MDFQFEVFRLVSQKLGDMRLQSIEERKAFLFRCGIIDENGKLAAKFSMPKP